MSNTTNFIRSKLDELHAGPIVSPQQLQQALSLLPKLPSLGAPEHADDTHDHLAAYYAMGPHHRQSLGLTPLRQVDRPLLAPVPSLFKENSALAETTKMNVSPLSIGVVQLENTNDGVKESQPAAKGKTFSPKLRIRIQAIFCRNSDGKLSDGRTGQTAQALGLAMTKIIAAVNAVFTRDAGIEFIFYPTTDLEIVNDTTLNQDFVLPASEISKLSKTPPWTEDEMKELSIKYTTTPQRNQYADKYPDKMVLLFAEGTRYFFDAANKKWIVSSPSGGGFSWEDLSFVKLSGEIGTTDAEAHGYVHGFLAHEMGHFLHLWHTFAGIYLTDEEFNDPKKSNADKLALIRKKVIDHIEAHRSEAPNGNLVLLLDGDRGSVTDTPPDEGTHILHFENLIAGTGNACGKDGHISLTLSDKTVVSYAPDRTLAMSYYKGCFDNTFTQGQADRMRNAIINGNRRRLVKTQLGDTAFPGENVCAVWNPNTKAQSYAWGKTLDSFQSYNNEMKTKGLYLTWQQAYTKKGVTYYDGIWNPGISAPRIIWGWTIQDSKGEDTKQRAAGNYMTHINSYLLPDGQVRINAIWYPGAHTYWIQGYTQQDFEKVFWEQTGTKTNQRLIQIDACNLADGQVRYDAIWTKGFNGQYAYVNMNVGDFQKKYGEMWTAKYKLTAFDAVRVGNEIRYSGIWDPNDNAQYIVWGHTREQIRQAYDEMWQMNMKLGWMSTVFF